MLGDAEELSKKFSDHEFVLPRQIVADITVTRTVMAEGRQCLIIDTLLLDD